ncbi:PREDICTED: uncharacterized protein LOC105460757, partial [Wasmannia auropunctata]|uniref:uncharacterized protein LOC105460757 n=1 Tax=Wasmannia auropunctata TaxID=64793 RepID=UPI0005EEC414
MFNPSPKFQAVKSKRRGKIWQLFRATDFESLMYPCFTFCRILGIFPYKINASTIKICKPCYILSTIVICIFCVYNLISIYDINFAFKSIPRALERNCFHIFGGFITVITFILSEPRMRLLQTILNLSLRLPEEAYQNLSKLIHIKDIFGFILLVVLESILLSRAQFDGILPKILILYIILLIFQMDMLYMNCVCVLKACFKQINDSLANLRELMANGEPYLVRGTYYNHRNPFLLMELKILEKQHLAVSEAVQMLKTIFSLQLLSTIIMAFFSITIDLYFYLMRIQGDVSMFSLKTMAYVEGFICKRFTNVTYHVIKMVLIVWACHTGRNQAMEINISVHDVFNSTSDEEIKYELRLFSLQLMHRKNIFFAEGLIMDATLLKAM